MAGDITLQELKDYIDNNYNIKTTSVDIGNPVNGPYKPSQIQPYTITAAGSIKPFDFNGINSQITLPDASELVFKSEIINGLHYEFSAELKNETVSLIARVYYNGKIKARNDLIVIKGNVNSALIEAHNWAQQIIEKKSGALDLFKNLIDEGKKKVVANLAMCLRKYIPS